MTALQEKRKLEVILKNIHKTRTSIRSWLDGVNDGKATEQYYQVWDEELKGLEKEVQWALDGVEALLEVRWVSKQIKGMKKRKK